MKSIIRKFKLIFFVLIYAFFSNSLLAIDPVVIGTKYQNDIEVNLSIIENLNKNRNQVEIIIKKDIRTKIKKRENVEIKTKNTVKEKSKTEDLIDKIDKKLARINKPTNGFINQIHILFNSETANLKNEDKDKIRNFVNNQTDKKNLTFKITSYAQTNKTEDVSRRLSLDRAINIRSIIMKEGVPARNLIVKSFGDFKNKENKVIIEFEKK